MQFLFDNHIVNIHRRELRRGSTPVPSSRMRKACTMVSGFAPGKDAETSFHEGLQGGRGGGREGTRVLRPLLCGLPC
jgi:hypothetical protein